MENLNYNYCFVCGKVCYSQREAGNIINSLKRHQSNDHRGRAKELPRRMYFCSDCGCYHLTHLKKLKKTRKHNINKRNLYFLSCETSLNEIKYSNYIA